MAQKRQISIAFTPEQHAWLDKRETTLDIPKAETIRRALNKVIQEEKQRLLAQATPANQTRTIL